MHIGSEELCSVRCALNQPAAAQPQMEQADINYDQPHTPQSDQKRVAGDKTWGGHAPGLNCRDNHQSKDQSRQRIHRQLTVSDPLRKGGGCVQSLGWHWRSCRDELERYREHGPLSLVNHRRG